MTEHMQAVLDSTPETVVDIALDTGHRLHAALGNLIQKEILTKKQYTILGETLIARKEHAEKRNPVLLAIVFGTRVSTQLELHEALGWNKYPDDKDTSFDVYT